MKKEILRQTARWVTAAMAENDPAHDPGHVTRVVKLTRQLCEACPEADAFRAELLAWLHDMNDEKLLRLYDLLSTDAAKELAKPRHEFLKEFYDRFHREA